MATASASTRMQLLGVKFAPLRVPLQRRLQTLAVCAWFVVMGLGIVLSNILAAYLLLWGAFYVRLAMVLYLGWIWLDRETCMRDGRRSLWVRNWVWWRYFCDYFPLTLVKTADLPPDRNYLFCSYPHGVLCAGAFGCFGTEGRDIADLFPGISLHPITLHQHFLTPFYRELVLGLGGRSASKESISWLLGAPGTGRAGVLLVGGAAESLFCRPGTNRIILRRRKGFVRLALQNGAPLVPVFSFGETDLYDQVSNPEGSRLRRAQEWVKRVTGVAPVVPIGRGLFQYSFGLAPRRRPVAVVVGSPIDVQRVEEPTQEQVDGLHQAFVDALAALFEEHKRKYVQDPDNTFLTID